ncbi:tetratricopeptide repeat protein [Caenimonas aquaedulcis]|uniref:Uncharacterized protein n=1 Tax=Caenimonas aquaedulcis TaxID=2793270 RepID=A0A931H5J1_9BURK|nr:hypothetical protein [Caenimonas aquaedulcis]MBG9389049.1 hypothetical protein [Caenimonas aquaedulcis]
MSGPPTLTPSRARALAAAGFALAALAGWCAWRVNLDRACVVQDTPYLSLCGAPARGSEGAIAALRARLDSNPGDANAYVELALAQRSAPAVAAASQVAPMQPSVLMLQAVAALEKEDWTHAIAPLVQLVEHRDTPQAALVLARLIAGGQGALMSPYLKPGTHWLPRVLAQLPQARANISVALPLIVQALQAGILEPDAIRSYTRQLKAAGSWADAYSLWLALQGRSLPILFNAGFDNPFQPDGFDWEIPAAGSAGRAGAIVERKGAEERGAVLDIRFTGRPIALPMARQPLFIGEGRWRLKGDYLARQFRAEQGLAWVVQCTASAAPAGRSEPLGDTGGAWRAFQFDFTVTPACGMAAVLQLETFAAQEAVLGARGRVAFDAFSLEKLGR